MRERRVDGIYCEGKRRLQLASLRSQIKKKKKKKKKKMGVFLKNDTAAPIQHPPVISL